MITWFRMALGDVANHQDLDKILLQFLRMQVALEFEKIQHNQYRAHRATVIQDFVFLDLYVRSGVEFAL